MHIIYIYIYIFVRYTCVYIIYIYIYIYSQSLPGATRGLEGRAWIQALAGGGLRPIFKLRILESRILFTIFLIIISIVVIIIIIMIIIGIVAIVLCIMCICIITMIMTSTTLLLCCLCVCVLKPKLLLRIKWRFSDSSKMHTSNYVCENKRDILPKCTAIEI